METRKVPRPEQARDAAEFVALLRQVKESCGFTYRELEQRAAARGDVLARSTLANALARDALPRAELVAAFVRACANGVGDGSAVETRVEEWLAARERIAASEAVPAALPAGPGVPASAAESAGGEREEAHGVPRRRRPRVATTVTAIAALALAGLAVWALNAMGPGTEERRTGRDSEGQSDADTAAGIPDGPVRLRPVQSPALCLTDGFVRDGRYKSHVAVHRACSQAAPPVTDLVPAGHDTYYVRWRHPEHGDGCLKARTSGAARGLLEPWEMCAAATRFRIERATSGDGEGRTYVLRLDTGQCVAAARPTPDEGTEATFRPCDDSRGQQYVISGVPKTG
ncbi:XRE family transcriptional regulator [Streptomyces spinoverrucosus]|uniref:XRE family transcriptional regulator n=1 Tax=Streptomyces spinoverrucosus TaxID=284043 RepID=UPI0018C3F7BC|nr:XRE family transcriptional regulator [Streptomyces spinoverrucosus]MBG0853896.1 XRE family transcriptional regulator [Streptomyces spinoverrucosus]